MSSLQRLTRPSVALIFATSFFASTPCRAQCQEWSKSFFGGGTPGEVHAFAEYDDGSGPALYVAGNFLAIGSVSANRIAKWDGTDWSPLGVGLEGGFPSSSVSVEALAVFDSGSGPELYAGGSFTKASGFGVGFLAKWNGTNWSAVNGGVAGTNAIVRAMTVFDDGSGSALYVGGTFTSAGGSLMTRGIVRWNGTSWSAVGGGIGSGGGSVYSLVAHDDGSGPALFMGGTFGLAGAATALCIAKWDGSSWSGVGGGMTGFAPDTNVQALAVFDDGSGAHLYAGGHFVSAGSTTSNSIAEWDGASWTALGPGISTSSATEVHALRTYDDGSGTALYVGGVFTNGGGTGVSTIIRWNGSAWSIVGPAGQGIGGGVDALVTFDAGRGELLVVGGSVALAAAPPSDIIGIASFDGTTCSALIEAGAGIHGGARRTRAFAAFDDGSGPAVYVGGKFTFAGDVAANCIARWNGSSWSTVSTGINTSKWIYALRVFDDGSGPALYAGGDFIGIGSVNGNGIGKWDGASWSTLGVGMGGTSPDVDALCTFDDGSGSALYASGPFTSAGGSPANRIAKWDGSTWSALGTGLEGGSLPNVVAMSVFDDGTGSALFASGRFTTAGGSSAGAIAKWNGTSWSALGTGTVTPSSAFVSALAVFDDGAGPALYASGTFTAIGGVSANHIAKWDGSTWTALGVGIQGIGVTANALAVFDDGTGPALYVGGQFNGAGAIPAYHLAKWSGSAWSSVGIGLQWFDSTTNAAFVDEIAVLDDGADGVPDLFVGGYFAYADSVQSLGIAEMFGCAPGEPYCFGDGTDSLVTALCPCGNFGDAGRGCANSNSALGGAHLLASGTTSPNTLVFTCDGIPNNSFSTFLRSNASDPSGFVFGDGIKCLNGTGIRFGAQNAGQGGNPPFTVSSPAATVASGNTRYYQLHYRNPNLGFCPPETFNISNGYRVAW